MKDKLCKKNMRTSNTYPLWRGPLRVNGYAVERSYYGSEQPVLRVVLIFKIYSILIRLLLKVIIITDCKACYL